MCWLDRFLISSIYWLLHLGILGLVDLLAELVSRCEVLLLSDRLLTRSVIYSSQPDRSNHRHRNKINQIVLTVGIWDKILRPSAHNPYPEYADSSDSQHVFGLSEA